MKKIIIVLMLFVILITPGILALEETLNIRNYEIIYTYEPDNVNEGDKFTLNVEITNNEELREDLKIELDSNSPFDIREDEWEIGTIDEDETKDFSFRIEVDDDASKGDYRIDFTIEDNKIDVEDSFDIELTSDEPELMIGEIKSIPSIISADEDNVELEITLVNTGGGDATFVIARLILPPEITKSTSYSDSASVGIIGAKGGQEVSFFIDTDFNVKSGDHPVALEIFYLDKSSKRTKRLEFPIPIKGKPLFEVTGTETVPSRLEAGGSGKLRITIENVGEEKAKETSIRVFETSDYPFSFNEKTNLIGTIDPGVRGTAIFDVDVDSDSEIKEYLLRIQVRTINNNNVIVSEEVVPVRVVQKEGGGINPLFFVVIIVLIILIVILIIAVSRGKRRKGVSRVKEVKEEIVKKKK
ncbi:hypothetical protein GOV12_05050 [Candidatus Pacearchaeota archaeon]|nr:hypothetical protein [Candidatus Pacearchaeota archaeon]